MIAYTLFFMALDWNGLAWTGLLLGCCFGIGLGVDVGVGVDMSHESHDRLY